MGAGLLAEALSTGLILITLIALAGCDGRSEQAASVNPAARPAIADPSHGDLPLPHELPRQVAVDTAFVAGDEYMVGWPSQRIAPDGTGGLEFTPQWDSAAPAAADLSYALYNLAIPEPAEYYTVRFDWSGPAPAREDLWIGVGNFASNAWDWRRVQACGVVAVPANAHVNASDQVYLALVCLAAGAWRLEQLAISINGTVVSGALYHAELEREYVLYVPAAYTGDQAVPLVFNFHGYTGTAAGHMERGDFRDVADANGFLVVHPQGALDVDGKTHFNVVGHGPGSEIDDVGFTAALLEALAVDYNIDLTRVYATGMSNGGFMSYLLACEMSEQFAAVASVAATMADALIADANPAVPVPVMEIHGTADTIVPYEGTAELSSVDEVLQYWVGHNSCNPTPATTALPDLITADGCTVEHIVYDQGVNGVTVELYRVIGGGHTWPGGGYALGPVNYDIDAAEEIWAFFARYDNSGLIE
ncbi:prolyl oligopeptidase family serine peptidase [bacterium]|nr:prolyl oligopeptidase family serine peptidase [bacterium]